MAHSSAAAAMVDADDDDDSCEARTPVDVCDAAGVKRKADAPLVDPRDCKKARVDRWQLAATELDAFVTVMVDDDGGPPDGPSDPTVACWWLDCAASPTCAESCAGSRAVRTTLDASSEVCDKRKADTALKDPRVPKKARVDQRPVAGLAVEDSADDDDPMDG